MSHLRETSAFVADWTPRGEVRITAKAANVTPKSRVVTRATWNALAGMSDDSFNGSIVLELGIGTFQKQRRAIRCHATK